MRRKASGRFRATGSGHKDHGQKSRDFEDEKQKLPDEWKALETEQIRLRIEKADSRIKGRLKEIEEWEAALADLREKSDKQKETMAKLRIEENSIRTELRMNRKNLAQLEAEMKRVSDNLLGVRRELAEHLEGSALTSAAAELPGWLKMTGSWNRQKQRSEKPEDGRRS